MINCPACQSEDFHDFYQVKNIPVHSVLLFETKDEARNFPKGDITLSYCSSCGFVWNSDFNPTLHSYSEKYEETQGFSETFSEFHRKLAKRLCHRYHLQDKVILEIGCGKGEFLSLLCELGNNRGYGVDPAYRPERNKSSALDRMTFIRDFYQPADIKEKVDFICCKMTLEHIAEVREFLETIRSSLDANSETVVFFQVPNSSYIFEQCAFWDVYYEHCSYFTRESLHNLFSLSGFHILDLWTDYDDQYLMIEAVVNKKASPTISPIQSEGAVTNFTDGVQNSERQWRALANNTLERGDSLALWGGGSKAVAFSTTLGLDGEISAAVDINPHKKGTFLAGTGIEIIAPSDLRQRQPDTVILMNPIYRSEVLSELEQQGLAPNLITLHDKISSVMK